MISIELNEATMRRLLDATQRAKKNFGKEVAAAINAVSKKTRLSMGREIRSVVTLKKDQSEKPIKVTANASDAKPSATVKLFKTPRLGLNQFGVRQDKRGVSYKISRKGGRERVEGGFMGPRPGLIKVSWKGNAFKRKTKDRTPIVKLQGVSAWGAYTSNNLIGPQLEEINAELTKQLERRINLNILRAEGLVKT